MSLTTFIENPDVRARFRDKFNRPSVPAEIKLKVPAKSKRYSLIGTAFDYLVRFLAKRLNRSAIDFPWAAEYSILNAMSPILNDVIFDGKTGQLSEYADTETSKLARQIIASAKINLNTYLASGEVSPDLIHSAICLAQLDPIMRARYVDPNLGEVHKEDIEELKDLISIVQPDFLKATRIALLNPTFGEGSLLVGGADADLVIDDVLIDVKTILKLELQLNVFHQLMGYVVLSYIGLLGDIQPRVDIATIPHLFASGVFSIELNRFAVVSLFTF